MRETNFIVTCSKKIQKVYVWTRWIRMCWNTVVYLQDLVIAVSISFFGYLDGGVLEIM